MTRVGGIKDKLTLLVGEAGRQSINVYLLHCRFQLMAGTYEVCTLVTSDALYSSPECHEASEALKKRICGHIIQHFNVNATGVQTGE